MSIKISPSVLSADLTRLGEQAKAAEAAGANAITAINTAGPGMVINIETAEPILANRVGGLSGPAIRPLAIKTVWEIFEAVKIPIIGTGGISNGRDAIEMMEAGATLVGIGSAVIEGVEVFEKIAQEMKKWCEQNEIENISDLIGKAHKNP